MFFVGRNNPPEGDDHHSRLALYEGGNADQHEEHQSLRSESQLPAEIPDSQPDGYLPSEIPDSQPDLVDHQDLPFGEPDFSEVSSQLPASDNCDIELCDASASNLGEYELREQAAVDPGDCNLVDEENIDRRASRFDEFRRGQIDDSIHEETIDSSYSRDTELILGGTRLTDRLKDRVVSPYQHHSIPATLPSKCVKSSRSK